MKDKKSQERYTDLPFYYGVSFDIFNEQAHTSFVKDKNNSSQKDKYEWKMNKDKKYKPTGNLFFKEKDQKHGIFSQTIDFSFGDVFLSFFLFISQSVNKTIFLFSKIKLFYIWCIVVAFWGYTLGIYYWNMSNNSLIFLQRSEIWNNLKQENIQLQTPPQQLAKKLNNSQATKDWGVISKYTSVKTQEYALEVGDTLYGVAARYDLNIDTLISWNNIPDARYIREGQKFIIPNRNGLLYTVKASDSLSSISKKYNVSQTNILDANNLKNSYLSIGRKLFIPNAKLDSFDRGLVLGTVFLAPIRGNITSYYGYRISPISGKRSLHTGVDIANAYGTPIKAAASGRVIYVSDNNPVFGKVVIIKHARGFQTLYGHMSSILVKRGERLKRGTVLGREGNTGESTGSHLHFTIIKNGRTVNPLNYIRL